MTNASLKILADNQQLVTFLTALDLDIPTAETIQQIAVFFEISISISLVTNQWIKITLPLFLIFMIIGTALYVYGLYYIPEISCGCYSTLLSVDKPMVDISIRMVLLLMTSVLFALVIKQDKGKEDGI